MMKSLVPPRGKRGKSPIFVAIFLAIVLVVFFARAGFGQSVADRDEARQLFATANQHYTDGEFAAALELYERLAREGFATREVLANAGNAAWMVNDTGRAVLFYKRALRVDPGYDLARQNLERIQPQTNLIEEDSFAALVSRAFARTSGFAFLLVAELIFLALLVSLAMVIRARAGSEARGDWWSRSAALALLFVVAGGLVVVHGLSRQADGDAVIVADGAVSRLEPSERAPGQAELPGGTVVHFSGEPSDGWVRFRLRDGTVGFIETSALQRI